MFENYFSDKMKFSILLIFVVLLNLIRESVLLPIKGSAGFKLPKPLTSETVITINGTMIIQKNILSVALVEKGGSHICEITYDTSKSLLFTTSQLTGQGPITHYDTKESSTPVEFSLVIEPKKLSTMFSINFYLEVDKSGQEWQHCETKSFDTVNRIVVKGAETIKSLLFQFEN